MKIRTEEADQWKETRGSWFSTLGGGEDEAATEFGSVCILYSRYRRVNFPGRASRVLRPRAHGNVFPNLLLDSVTDRLGCLLAFPFGGVDLWGRRLLL